MYTYEISVCLRDSLGNLVYTPDGRVKKKSFSSDKADDIADFYNRNCSKKPKRKKKNAQSDEKSS